MLKVTTQAEAEKWFLSPDARDDSRVLAVNKRGAQKEVDNYPDALAFIESDTIDRDVFGEYALLDSKIAALEAQKEQLKPAIMEEIIKSGQPSAVFPYGKFTVSKYKTWTYPERITKQEEELKAEKAKAQSTGEATAEEKDSLRYTSAKL